MAETTEPAEQDQPKWRRGRLVEGGVIVALGLAMLAQSWYFHGQDVEQERATTASGTAQQRCLSDNFAELSKSLDARSELSQRETSQNKKLWLLYAEAAGLLKDDPTAELKPADQRRLQIALVKQLLEYKRVITSIEEERREHPVPPYPVGQCTG